MASDPLSARYPDLEGKAVVITGGATGIGASLVRAFADQRAVVDFLDIDETSGEALAQAVPRARFHALDLTDTQPLRETFATIARDRSRIDILINNASRDDRHAMSEVEPGDWRKHLAVNLDHQFFASQVAANIMCAQGSGSIVMTSSTSFMKGRPGMVGYTTAKAAVVGLTRTLARELGPSGVRVNCLIPGAIRTERQNAFWRSPEADAEILAAQALKIDLSPAHVAAMALFLASDASSGCTGANFLVDAGLT
ncbi:SDR family oxidoreductase [Tianweitania sp. BSSL-BM11]|uniref:SDR family oxidoreductase n=1 Tax=Tianweitania aestuarii TaxID=2814886 RepID=A0ABS5S2B8_9HYPH|nr:SDR family oxidoreductase [Tianweitania aestuarii]MBS9722067.1 SDR family oxidoreductase [Tianweitania aestuarii]